MKGTRLLDTYEIRKVAEYFESTYEGRNCWLWFLFIILGLFIACGGDTNTANTQAVVLVEVKSPRVRSAADRNTWHADFDIVFEGVPIDLKAEFDRSVGFHRLHEFGSDWEQTRNIVTLRFEFKLFSIITYRNNRNNSLILERSDQKQSVDVTLTWADGRKTFTVEAYPPKSLFVGRSDILSLEE